MQSIIYEVDARGIATVTLNRPDVHNAFDDLMIAELTEVFSFIDQDKAVRALLLKANGKSFCAGADLNWMKKMVHYSRAQNKADAEKLALMLHKLFTLCKPTIARVQGPAYGGAVGLIACCDIAVGSKQSKFGLTEVKLGLIPATISPYVIQAIGVKEAKRLFLTAESISSKQAKRLGLLSEQVKSSELDNVIEDLLSKILKNGPSALSKAKQLALDVSGREIDPTLISSTSQCIADIRVSEEGQEGLTAFLEKRRPHWQSTDE
ncbi:MAG: enoyl-CoA hydratase/isomerase family protein [Pseudomonadota bacterium]